MANRKTITKPRRRPQPALPAPIMSDEQFAMALRAWRERGIVILWPHLLEEDEVPMAELLPITRKEKGKARSGRRAAL